MKYTVSYKDSEYTYTQLVGTHSQEAMERIRRDYRNQGIDTRIEYVPETFDECVSGEEVLALMDDTVMSEELYAAAEQRLYELCPDYAQEIADWDWDGIKADCAASEGACYLGTVFGLYPSGKVYTFWTTNQTLWDTIRDEAFSEALGAEASMLGLWLSGSDGDPCDVFAYWSGDLARVLSDGAQGLVLEQTDDSVRVMFAHGFVDSFQLDEVEIYERDQ